ncbi:hypothetical protein EYF80_035623 [Liparis tanakae]|uniref:Uncharacterized protein n=1 Tax=Liparis tanakae TaxID=230148 RepID=A0A4Z2GLP8_9TELE|nr:hypothetical protein EYF80_035623 [Liparis tanakae]
MLDVLIWVEACLWKLPGVALEVEPLSSPLTRTTKPPAGTPLKVTRKLPLPTDWRTREKGRARDNQHDKTEVPVGSLMSFHKMKNEVH